MPERMHRRMLGDSSLFTGTGNHLLRRPGRQVTAGTLTGEQPLLGLIDILVCLHGLKRHACEDGIALPPALWFAHPDQSSLLVEVLEQQLDYLANAES